MSRESYRRNVSLGVTGLYKPTCFPAALEQISPRHVYKPSVYKQYEEFGDWWDSFSPRQQAGLNSDYGDMITDLVKPLGGYAWQDLVFHRATTARGLARLVTPLLAEDYRVVVDIDYYYGFEEGSFHSVGLVPARQEGLVRLVSNHVPPYLRGAITLDLLGEHLAPTSTHYKSDFPFDNANIMALPPS